MKPKALDLFCGPGGATRGLQAAGFEVTGVDLVAWTGYPGEHFLQGDALDFPIPVGCFDLIWASPPCQAFTAYKRRPGHVAPKPNHIPAIRERLQASGAHWVIENVPGAPLINPLTLCGSMFGLDVRRHRIFERSFDSLPPCPCAHHLQTPRFAPATNRTNLRSTVEVGVWRIPLDVQQKAMGIEGMSRRGLSQAVPPAYAEWLARTYLRHVSRSRQSQLGP